MSYEYEMGIALVILGVHIGIVIMAIADYYNAKEQPNDKVNDIISPDVKSSLAMDIERIKQIGTDIRELKRKWEQQHINPQQDKINNTKHEMD